LISLELFVLYSHIFFILYKKKLEMINGVKMAILLNKSWYNISKGNIIDDIII